jgi:hypothetical protein
VTAFSKWSQMVTISYICDRHIVTVFIKSSKRTGLDEQEKKCLKIDRGPGWNQRVKWLGESWTSIGTHVPRASHDDNKWWYRGLEWTIQI